VSRDIFLRESTNKQTAIQTNIKSTNKQITKLTIKKKCIFAN